MPETTLTFRHVADLLLKRLKLKIGLSILAGVAAFVLALQLPDVYESEAKLLIHNSLLASKVPGVSTSGLKLDTFLDFFDNRTVAERIIARHHLEMGAEELLGGVEVKQLRGKDIVRVTYEHEDPREAQQILTGLIDGATELMQDSFLTAEAKLRAEKLYHEVKDVSAQVERKKELLRQVREQYGYDEHLNDANAMMSIIGEYEQDLARTRANHQGFIARQQVLEEVIADVTQILELDRVAELPEGLERLRASATNELQNELGRIEWKVEAINDVYDMLQEEVARNRMALEDSAARIRFIQENLGQYRDRLDQARRKRDEGKLRVDHAEYQYGILRDTLTNLLAQYQSVGAVVANEGQQIQVIDRPSLEREPAGPPRLLMVLAAMVLTFVMVTLLVAAVDAYYRA